MQVDTRQAVTTTIAELCNMCTVDTARLQESHLLQLLHLVVIPLLGLVGQAPGFPPHHETVTLEQRAVQRGHLVAVTIHLTIGNCPGLL